MTFDLAFESLARGARLNGMMKGYARVLRRMREKGLTSDPLYGEIYNEMMQADEAFAAKGSTDK